jgi:nicotinate-nucleotide pyrophosphorylase (carboxylating)
MSRPAAPPQEAVDEAVRRALHEDLGEAGDVTSAALIQEESRGRGVIRAEQTMVAAGVTVALQVFSTLDRSARPLSAALDGDELGDGDILLDLEGSARALLAGERTALNFLGRLCGIATATRQVVESAADTPTRIVDTRKTTPGLRALEKYAVRCGGGVNHRAGLYDMALIKENHIAMVDGVADAVSRCRAALPDGFPIQVEVSDLNELEQALQAGADRILLDNMGVETLAEAVRVTRGRAELEASGGIAPAEAGELARLTGVDRISLGALTRESPWAELSMDLIGIEGAGSNADR